MVLSFFVPWFTSHRAEAERGRGVLPESSSASSALVEIPVESAEASRQSRAARAAEPADRSLNVVVTDEHSTPLSGVRVVLFDSNTTMLGIAPMGLGRNLLFGSPWEESTTDAKGVALFAEPDASRHDLMILAAESLPVLSHRAADSSMVRVTVAREVTLRGLVRVDGLAPTESMVLEASGFRDPASDWCAGARELLRCLGGSGSELPITVTDGSFALRGISRLRPLTLRAPWGFVQRDGSAPQFVVPSGADQVTLELSRVGGIEVRVRERASTNSTAHALVLEARYRDSKDAVVEHIRSPLAPSQSVMLPIVAECAALDLLVSNRDTGRWLARHHESNPRRGGVIVLDVPEIEQTLTLWVRDESGKPASGASAKGAEWEWRETNQAGRLEIDLRVSLPSLVVGAPGCAALDISLPTPLPEQMTVTLPRATQVQLAVAGVGPTLASRLGVHVTTSLRSPCARERLSGSPPSELDSTGHWFAEDLPAGVPLTLSLQDRYGFELQQYRLTLLQGEHRDLSCDLHRQPWDASLRVLDADGAPIQGAQVSVVRATPIWFDEGDAQTDADGRAILHDLFDPDPSIEVFRASMVPRRLKLSSACREDVRLEASRTLEVRVDRPAGADLQPLDVRLVIPNDPSSPYRAVHESEGYHRFDHVPRKAGVVSCANPVGEVAVGAETTDVTLVLSR